MINNNIDRLMDISKGLSEVCTELTNHILELVDSKGVNLTDKKVFNIMDKLTHDVGKLQRQTHRIMDIIDEEMDDLK